MIAVNPTTGAVTTITALGSARGSDLAFAPDGTLYVCEASLITRVSPTGAVTVVATGLGSADGMAITPDGAHMFIADSGTDTVVHFTLPGLVRTPFATADIDSGDGTGGIIVAPGGISGPRRPAQRLLLLAAAARVARFDRGGGCVGGLALDGVGGRLRRGLGGRLLRAGRGA